MKKAGQHAGTGRWRYGFTNKMIVQILGWEVLLLNRLKEIKWEMPAAGKGRSRLLGKAAYCLCLTVLVSSMLCQPVLAATDVWAKAGEIMKDVYNQIVLISTVAAIVTASVALLMMNFSKSGKTVDECRAWLKRICITWAILNGLGFIMAYLTPFFADGKWNG